MQYQKNKNFTIRVTSLTLKNNTTSPLALTSSPLKLTKELGLRVNKVEVILIRQ